MRSLLLALGFTALFAFASPGQAQVLPPCCVSEGEIDGHPPDPHTGAPVLLPAEVTRRDERALSTSAEAPVEQEAPLADAVANPRDLPLIIVPPIREPIIATDQQGLDDHLPPCCQIVGEVHPPDPDQTNKPPVLVGAEVKKRDERSLKAAVKLSIPVETPLVNAIGIPLTAPRGISDPIHRPAPADVAGSWLNTIEDRIALLGAVLALLLGIVGIGWWRLRPERVADNPSLQRPCFSGERLLHNLAASPRPAPVSEPTRECEPEPV